jgi:protein FrlC
MFYSFDYFLKSAAEIGFQSIDIWTGYPHLVIDEDYVEKCKAVRLKCDKLGLRVDNVTPKVIGWPLNIADADDKVRNRAIKYLQRCMEAADILGAETLQLVPGTGLYDEPVEPAWERARQSLITLAKYAQDHGKILGLEAIQIVESNLINNKDQLLKMLNEVDSPALKAVVDTTHMEKNGETLEQYFETLGSRICRIHLNESDQVAWGDGHSSLDEYLVQLNRYGYQGPITVEICSRPHYLKPYASLQQTYNYMSAAINRQH